MKMKKLGRTGMDVSALCLGCMTYGVPERGPHPWTLPEEESRPLIKKALDLGINFFDTANFYSDGTSEEIVGRALRDYGNRDSLVIATKCYFPLSQAPNAGGLSRKAIFQSIDASLKRLGTDYVDLFQIHRWDYATPIEVTLEALHDVVKAGKARYLGASSMFAWQFAKALFTADRHGWTRFATMQDHYNLLHREEEREMHPLCADQGVAIIPWSPLARGRLTRDWDESSARQQSDEVGKTLYRKTEEADRQVVEKVAEIAAMRGVSRAQVALSWVASRQSVTAPIIGASKPQHLDDAVAALRLRLNEQETEALEELYVPHAPVGFS
ncbi:MULTISPECIES: aldo/keto reductase [Methylobacterium]|jgi:1-deoxyxylulose-5-phosphate synthase|uniref:1-deoxyxylulose-5-phosphate synthase YajO n=3 Tax=Pseudomonadota TaxID=1224 RepID=A0ABQ4SSL8_9HYPH|nr:MULTISPECIES: aldo/keto reductase [Methylobacterium]PIU06700.1 MAG: alcohol dehydrogenase [Methylobacterium sp. CG09_land_8_20_14_0_10_71_15]PIU12040.1 MAG: alcohol dehydrogenase [Methylobacterium sp. CG08_land_8_20_14_0_20_71_15]GBU19286.1 2-carboxybenzaldehyde reductase [Methylobacterium sp.]GJE04779.1 1-deoxyxylulose-5-phosphate synthase YajO [Methylobacterium jeotgali]